MKLINGFDLMEYARSHGYILGAFNTSNLELTYSIVRGLEKAGFPGYIQISSRNLEFSNPYITAAMAKDALKKSCTPVGLHLDHGKSFEDVMACVDAGFTSIMIDASHLPFAENIREVRRCSDYCHFYGIPVEAELGAIRGKEDDLCNDDEGTTDPDAVESFVRETACDLLAVSIGNVHGLDAKPEIDLALLEKIYIKSPVPLVLHGGSGIPADIIRQAKKFGLLKINYASDLRRELIRAYGEPWAKNHNAHNLPELTKIVFERVASKTEELARMINM